MEPPKTQSNITATSKRTWRIPNFDAVVSSDALASTQKMEMKTVPASGTKYTWLIGLKRFYSGISGIYIFCQLCEINGNTDNESPRVEAAFQTSVRNIHGDVLNEEVTVQTFILNDETAFAKGNFLIQKRQVTDDILLTPDRAAVINVRLTVLKHENLRTPVASITKSKNILRDNILTLLSNEDGSDVKIVTRDKMEFNVHKIILKLQNAVFEAMLSLDYFPEFRTGVVNENDLCGKTMEIILHLLYTGMLLPSWKDPDTIVEFTFAAEKYQLKEVLRMLDAKLGDDTSEAFSKSYVSLMKFANKLPLRNAEKKLKKRISEFIGNTHTAEDFFAMVHRWNS